MNKKYTPLSFLTWICTTVPGRDRAMVVDSIELENGDKISVQANFGAYCTPRNNEGPYTAVEVWFPENVRIPASWEQYGSGNRKERIFCWVPVEKVKELILARCPSLRGSKDKQEKMDARKRKDWFDKLMRG